MEKDQYQKVSEQTYECLLFDVDDTIYPLSSGLSAQVTKNIIEYMITKLGTDEAKASEMCVQLYKEYGTTMAGLKAIGYDFDYDDYHGFVHGRLPYEMLKPDPVLRSILHSLPIRKVIFSNGNEEHVAKVLNRLGLEDCFERVICFETLNPARSSVHANENQKSLVVCKPFEESFEMAFKAADINPHKTIFFDDSIRNLQTAKRMGLHSVWVGSSHRANGVDYALESIHNMKEALPELWEAVASKEEPYSRKAAIATPVRA